VRTVLAGGLLAVLLGGLLAATNWSTYAIVYLGTRQLVWSGYAVMLTGAAVLWRGEEDAPSRQQSPSPAGLAILALMILNGLGPYLGLKTRAAFDMYSNLRVEADRSNHLIVPRSLDVLGVLRDRVTILETSDPILRAKYAEPGYEITYFELASRLRVSRDTRVRYVRSGEECEYDAGRGDLLDAPPFWQRKLLIFRPLGERGRAQCVW